MKKYYTSPLSFCRISEECTAFLLLQIKPQVLNVLCLADIINISSVFKDQFYGNIFSLCCVLPLFLWEALM